MQSILASPEAGIPLERRSVQRRVCRVSVFVHVADLPAMKGKTVDLSADGAALLLPVALRPGQVCRIGFSLYLNGALQQIVADGEVTNCVFLSTNVRVGLRFVSLDEQTRRTLQAFVR